MTRILSYNILVGATRRVDPLTDMIKAARPDIVGLVEATNPKVLEELAHRLDMQHVVRAIPTHLQDWQVALLSRLPITYTKTHLLTKPALAASVEEANGRRMSALVTQLAADF